VTGVCVVDYGAGNLRSLRTGLERAGAEVTVTDDADRVAAAERVLVPGVGAAGAAMAALERRGLAAAIREAAAAGAYVFGICLGLQLLFESSSELGGGAGLGLLAGEVTALQAPGLKLPHIGWEAVLWETDCELAAGIESGTPFYFVHSFAVRPADPADILGVARHGETFVCAVARHPVYGAQFHPEKSSAAGLELLRNFDRLCAKVGA
jgi:glutamine amidotransferase